jgi:hyperosmotically inducible protein
MKTIKSKILALAAVMMIAVTTMSATATAQPLNEPGLDSKKIEKIRKELVTLPYYGVFDNLAYKVEAGTVTLYGQVVRPSTRTDAERRVKKIEGVERVINNIEVLPLSSFDDSIRRSTHRQLARTGGLYRYLLGANPSLHIIVSRGRLTLEGVVANKSDRQLAYIVARGVSGVFSVTNNLRTDNPEDELN